MIVASVPGTVDAQDAPAIAPTSGQALAELIRIDPAIASLALTISAGTTIAGHQNGGSGSQASSLSFGMIGDLLTAEGCDGGDPLIPATALPESLLIDSSMPTAADGVTGGIAGIVDLVARADITPTASSSSTLVPLHIPGLIEIKGGKTSTTSTGTTATSTAISEIANISLLEGVIQLEGLRWMATRTLGPNPTMSTDFTIGALRIAGAAVPLPDGIGSVVEVLQPVLATLGFALQMPEPYEIPNGIGLSALSVGIVPAEVRDSVLGAVLGAVQPVREPLFDQLLELDCGNATYLTVLDVVLGSISGAGSLTVDLGGVTAAVSPIELSSFLGGTPAPSAGDGGGLGQTPSVSDSGATPDLGGSLPIIDDFAPLDTTPIADDGDDEVAAPAALTRPAEGKRGGALLYVGLIGLLGVALAAGAEHFKMRKGQRSGPMTPSA